MHFPWFLSGKYRAKKFIKWKPKWSLDKALNKINDYAWLKEQYERNYN